MARGDNKFFASFFQKAFDGVGFDLNSGDTLKLGIIDNTLVPTVSTPDPRWGIGGSTDFSLYQVSTSTGYPGPVTLASVVFTRSANVITLNCGSLISVPLDVSGFTNGYWGIIFDDTVAGKYALGFVDLAGPVSISNRSLTMNVNVAGYGRLTVL